MAEALRHVTELADHIGPRPATTDSEARAADYIGDEFRSYGLDVSRQDFDCPRTYAWTYVAYHAATIISAVALAWTDAWGPLRWVAFGLAAITAIAMWFDLDTRSGLSSLMPKGPSQNIIAKSSPRTRRGERLTQVVIVAHYDSAKASLAFAPGMVKNFEATFTLMKLCTFLVPVLIFVDNLRFTGFLDPYLWYATLVIAGYLVVPLLINVHREIVMRGVDGANDNASGVAALLSLAEQLAPGDDVGSPVRMHTQPWSLELDEDLADAMASSSAPFRSPAGSSELPEDFEWASSPEQSDAPRQAAQSTLDFGTLEFEALETTRARHHGLGVEDDGNQLAFDSFGRQEQVAPAIESRPAEHESHGPGLTKRGLLRFGKKKDEPQEGGMSSWLGVEKGFDAREKGKGIGHWDNFEDDDDSGTLGGRAGDDRIGDPDYSANEASRIRRRVTERVDRDLAEKEIWFVATGAEEVGTWGMKAFLGQYGEEIKGAFFINLDNIGAGNLHWVTSEGMAKRYPSDRRLVSLAKKVSRSEDILAKGRAYKGLSTDATPALARRFRAMSIMAFDVNGRLPNWHWHTDTTENIDPENIEAAVALTKGIVREL